MPDFDLDGALSANPLPGAHAIAVAFEVHGEGVDGEIAELDSGWENSPDNPIWVEPDEYDTDEGKTAVSLTVDYLRGEGAVEASSSHFHQGVWYICNGDMDAQGCYLNRSYHLKGFTEDEELSVFRRLTGNRRIMGRVGPPQPA